MFWLDREMENSISFSMGTSSWSAKSSRLCHFPFLNASKYFSLVNVVSVLLLFFAVFILRRTFDTVLDRLIFCTMQNVFYRTKLGLLHTCKPYFNSVLANHILILYFGTLCFYKI